MCFSQLIPNFQNYSNPYRSSSPMRAERSHSPRMSPYPLSPSSSSSHLSDYGHEMPIDQMSTMRLNGPHSPQPPSSYAMNGSPGQPSFLNGYAQQTQQLHQPPQLQRPGSIGLNGYPQSPYQQIPPSPYQMVTNQSINQTKKI